MMRRYLPLGLLLVAVTLTLTLLWPARHLRGQEPLTDAFIYEEAQLVYLANLARRDSGVPPLRWNRQLTNATRWFSWDSVVNRDDAYCGHEDSQGDWPADRARRFGYLGFGADWENAFCGYGSPDQVIQGWLNSPAGHRENLLNSGHREMGPGYYRRDSDGRGYVVGAFGTDLLYPPVVIEHEALNTATPDVDLYIYDRFTVASDQVGVDFGFAQLGPALEMRVSNERCLADTVWEPYTAEKDWSLQSGEGWREVYVQTRDAFSRTVTVSDTIYLGNEFPVSELSLHQASTVQDTVTLYNLANGNWPLMQFSPGWAVDDTFWSFKLHWGNGERVDDPAALGGTAFRLSPGAGESMAWVNTTEFIRETPLVAYVRLKTSDNNSPAEIARFSVTGGGVEYGPRSIAGTDFDAAGQYQEFALPFTYHDDPNDPFLTISFWRGGDADVYIDAVHIFSAPVAVSGTHTWSVPGGNYRGQGVWVRYTDQAGTFSPIMHAQTEPDVQDVRVQPTTLTFRAPTQSGLTPPQTVTVTPLACEPVPWQASADADWLLVQSEDGTAGVRVDTAMLAAGDYQATLTITAAGNVHTVPIAVTITPPADEWIYLPSIVHD